MSTVIGNLRVVLGLDSGAFQNTLRQSQNSFRNFGRQMTTIGLGIAAAGAATFAAFNNSASRLTELQKQAAITGLSAQEFKIAALAADQYGVSQEKLSDILKDVNDRLGDFRATGGGEMAQFFENIAPKVGLTIEAFEGLSSSEALALYVTSLQKANISQAEMTFYMEALADEATALVPVFGNSGQALADMAARADELGLALDENLIKTAKQAQSDIGLVSEVLRTQFDQAVLKLGPSLSQLAAALMPVVDGMGGLINKTLEWTNTAGQASRKFVDDFIGALSGLPMSASGIIAQLAAATAAAMTTIAQQAAGWAKAIVRAIIDGLAGLYQAGVDAIAELARGMRDSVTGLIADAASWGRDIASGLTNGISEGAGRVKSAVTGLAQGVKGWFTDEVEIQSPSKVFARFGGWLTEGLSNGIDGGAGDVEGSMRGLAGGMLGHFQGVTQGARSLSDVFDNIKQSFASMLDDMSSRLMQSGMNGLLGSLFSSFDPLAGALRGAGLAAVPAFANGVTNFAGGLATINERGGELVSLPGGSTVIPHDLSKGMIQSGGMTRLEVGISPDLEVRILDQAASQSVQITQQSAQAQAKALPEQIQRIQAQPRRR